MALTWPVGNRAREGFQTSSTPKVHSRHIAFFAVSSCHFLSYVAPNITCGLPRPSSSWSAGIPMVFRARGHGSQV